MRKGNFAMSCRTTKTVLLAFAFITLAAAASPANAHHSFAMFDTSKSVRLEGTVNKFEWTNPHSWIFLNVPNAQSVPEQWIIELPAAGLLVTEGWNKNYLRTGDKIIVRIKPLKSGQRGGMLEGFTAADESGIAR